MVVVGLVVVLVGEVVVVLDVVVVVSLPASDEHAVPIRARTTVMASTRRMTDLHCKDTWKAALGKLAGTRRYSPQDAMFRYVRLGSVLAWFWSGLLCGFRARFRAFEWWG